MTRDNPEKGLVLLVDDIESTSLVVKTMLEVIGFDVDCAYTGREAVEMALTNSYLAILMDVEMPVMDGITATKIIRERGTKDRTLPLPIIGITGHRSRGIKVLCERAGMDDVLPKPFLMDQLAAKLEAASLAR